MIDQTAPSERAASASNRVLEPVARLSEALFGLIMVLTFTCTLNAAEAGREDVRAMLIGALGCNLAWGIIDALFYLMGILSEKGQGIGALRAVRGASDPRQAQRIIADALPPVVASVLEPAELERLRERLRALPEPPARPRLGKREWLGAVAVFLWVVAITFPVAAPFLLVGDPERALRVSNLIAILLLFVGGWYYGRWSGLRPWRTGVVMVVFGVVVVAMTIALGG